MNPDSTLHKAIELAKKATQEDEAGNYQEAIRLYSSAIDYFMHVTKFEKPPEATKKQIRGRMEEYLSRAEVLKTALQKKASRPIKAGDGGGTKKGDKNADDDEDDDKEAKKLMSKMEGAIIEKPNVKFSDVAGLEYAKQALEEAVMLPIKFPNMFTGKRKPWKGILLYGPPGTGKSFLAKAVATEANQSTFFCISSSDIVTKWLGESEKMVKNLFQVARMKAPSIIFIDEVDSLCSARSDSESESSRRIKTEFLVQMQGAGSEANNVLVLAATNIPWCIDDGFRRRFQRRIYIPLPDEKARFALFKMNLNENAHSLTDDDFIMLAKKTENYSGADIYNIALQAIYEPLRKVKTATHFKRVSRPSKDDKKIIVHDMLIPCSPGDPEAIEMSYSEVPADKLVEPDVTLNDVLRALADLKPSVSLEDLEKFEKFTRDYGSDGS